MQSVLACTSDSPSKDPGIHAMDCFICVMTSVAQRFASIAAAVASGCTWVVLPRVPSAGAPLRPSSLDVCLTSCVACLLISAHCSCRMPVPRSSATTTSSRPDAANKRLCSMFAADPAVSPTPASSASAPSCLGCVCSRRSLTGGRPPGGGWPL